MSLLAKIMKTFSAAIMAVTISYSSSVSAAPMPAPVIQGGQLVGIDNINVSGFGLYNMTFNEQYQGNTSTQAFAQAAGNAAIELGTGTGLFQGSFFDLNPEFTRGCGDLASPSVGGGPANSVCFWVVVTEEVNGIGAGVAFSNFGAADDSFDNIFSFTGIPGLNFQDASYTDWTKVSEVPVPAALFMFAPALLGILGLRRKMKS
jgi:hypothetical protein